MAEMLEAYAKYGKPIHLSEVTVLSSDPFKDWREMRDWKARVSAARKARKKLPFRASTPEGEQRQARTVRDFYTLAFSHPAVEAIVWWSVTDRGACRPGPGHHGAWPASGRLVARGGANERSRVLANQRYHGALGNAALDDVYSGVWTGRTKNRVVLRKRSPVLATGATIAIAPKPQEMM